MRGYKDALLHLIETESLLSWMHLQNGFWTMLPPEGGREKIDLIGNKPNHLE